MLSGSCERSFQLMNQLTVRLWLFLLLLGLPQAWSQTSPAKPAAPKGKPLLLLAPFTGEKLVVRATSVTTQNAVLQVELPDGSRNAWDKTAFVAMLSWYPEAELAGGAVDLSALGKLYDDAARIHPEFAGGILAEKAKVQAIVTAREKDRAAKVSAVLSDRYDPTSDYTADELRARFHAADEAAALAPTRQAEIARAIAPFREHLVNLEAGKVFVDGQWRTPEEVRREQALTSEAARLRALTEHLQIPLETQVLDSAQIGRVLWTAGAVLGMPVVLGLVLVFRRRKLVGGILILLPVVAGTLGVRALLSTDFPLPAFADAPDAEEEIVRAIDAAETTPDTKDAELPARRLHVSEGGVNAFLSHHVRLQGEAAQRGREPATSGGAFPRRWGDRVRNGRMARASLGVAAGLRHHPAQWTRDRCRRPCLRRANFHA